MNENAQPYYHVEYVGPTQSANLSWRGRVRVRRQDTDEIVDQLSVRECKSEKELEHRLMVFAEAKLRELPQPPENWGKEAMALKLINRYLAIRDQTYGFFVRAGNEVSEMKAEKLRREGDAFEALALQELKGDVSALPEEQKVELISPTSKQIEQRTDPRVLDFLSAKKMLFGLIEDPSEKLQTAYQKLLRILDLE